MILNKLFFCQWPFINKADERHNQGEENYKIDESNNKTS